MCAYIVRTGGIMQPRPEPAIDVSTDGILTVEAHSDAAYVEEDNGQRQIPFQVTMRHALAQLPEQQRQMIVLARYEHHSASQIAQELQVSVATVYAQLRVGLHALGALLPGQ